MFSSGRSINFTVKAMSRQIQSCAVLKSTVNKQAKFLTKLMTGSHRKKKNWHKVDFMAKVSILPSNKSFQQGAQTKRRVDVLNKLFMHSITDLLATGSVANDLIGQGITITRVKVATDFNIVNVYWTAKGTPHTAELEKALENAAFELRHELCQLHVMGKVPKICFVPDKWQRIFEDTEQCLQIAACKDECVVEESEESEGSLESKHILELPVRPGTLGDVGYGDNELSPLPSMTHNVLGLDHAVIMSKIQASVEKSQAKHRQGAVNDRSSVISDSDNKFDDKHYGVTPTDITQYIVKQRILKKKAQQALRKRLQEEMIISNESCKEEEYVDLEDGDFIEDYEDEMRRHLETKEK